MKLYSIKTAYTQCQSLYGVTVSEDEFEDMALNAWELIGNRHTRLYKYIGSTENQELQLPCNVDLIESVHIPILDAKHSGPEYDTILSDAIYTEHYIESYKRLEDPYYSSGKLVRYDEGDNVLYFSRDYPSVKVIYHGVLVDEEGLPLVSNKEVRAIATYIAYSSFYKEGLRKRDNDSLTLAQTLKMDWLQQCNAARVPEYLSQNDMDAILDAGVRWDRKRYGKSFKPIL